VSAVPGHFLKPETRETERDENDAQATFWHWFALAALLFAWIAEATMCAERGF
jgi:hypothetical protein